MDDRENVHKPTPHSLFGTMDFLHAHGNSELGRPYTPAQSIFKWVLNFDLNVLAGFEV